MSPILGIWASAQIAANSTSYESIATYTVGAGGIQSFEFTSIPQTYTHLQIRSSHNSANDINCQFNGDTGNNYYGGHQLRGDGASATSAAFGTANVFYYAFPQSASNTFSVAVVDILDYSNTNKNKTVRELIGTDANGSGFVGLRSNLWMSTNAITSIKFDTTSSSNKLNQYSTFALYGIK